MADATPAVAAPAEELTEAQAKDVFAEMAAAKAPPAEDDPPEVVETPTPAPAAPVAAAPTPANEGPKTAAPAPAAAATDIWANASPELRAAHEAALAKEQQKYRSDIGRQASYQAQIAALREELKAKTAPPAATTTTPTSLRENPNLKKTLEEYPEVAGPLVDAFEGALKATKDENERLKGDVRHLKEDHTANVISQQEAALTAAHSDWRAACASKEFADWLATRTEATKQMIVRNGQQVVDAAEAIEVLDNFKAHLALTRPRPAAPAAQPVAPAAPATPAAPINLAARRDAQLRAVTATPSGGPAASTVIDSNDDKAMFDHFAAKKAKRN